jgi:hypothetical protein
MSAPRFFTDEDIYAAVAAALRKREIDATSTSEADRFSQSDEAQLVYATSEGRVLVTFNVAHFASLHAAWMEHGKHHAGIVVSSQRPIGDVLRRLLRLAGTLDADSLKDRLEFLGDW